MTDRAGSQISVDGDDGRHVAAADIEVLDSSEVWASPHVESGHLPVGTRTRLVDAVLDTPEVSSCQHVQVPSRWATPRFSTVSANVCDTGEVRATGATCLVEADVPGRPDVELS